MLSDDLPAIPSRIPSKMRRKPTIRYRSQRQLFGLPLIDIAFGPDSSCHEKCGVAKGLIAIGNVAVGIVAIGGVAAGVVSIAGVSCGLLTIGGVACGGFVLGGVAVGGVTCGGVAIGIVAVGGVAIGYYARGGATVGMYVINALHSDPKAVEFFRRWLP
jgi:hypothetical protein